MNKETKSDVAISDVEQKEAQRTTLMSGIGVPSTKEQTGEEDVQHLWNTAKTIYLQTITSQEDRSQAERYLDMITRVEKKDKNYFLYAINDFVVDLIITNHLAKLKGSFILVGSDHDITLEVKKDTNYKPATVVPTANTYVTAQSNEAIDNGHGNATTFVSTLPLNEDYTFQQFVRGPSNSFALSAAEGVVKNPGKTSYNPLFIHGGTGLGKTHLMQAIGNELKKNNPSLSICYLTAETFLNEYVNSLQNSLIESFRHKYRSLDLLLIDDIQFFQRGKDVQEEFFNTFNALQGQHKQIVMTSDVAPKNLPAIESRLISRFEGGMVQEIESPSYETRLAILKKKAEMQDVTIPDSIIEFIADNIKSHVRAMEGALTKVSIYLKSYPASELNTQTLNYLLKNFIEKEQSLKKLTIKEIQQACATRFKVTMEEILSHGRLQSVVTPRQLAMYIARKYTTKSLQEIATAFDKKHATIISGIRTITQRLNTEAELRVELEEILASLGYKISDALD